MIINCREWKSVEDRQRQRVFVDGVEILQVWYVDTDAGFVRTYDVLGDGRCHSSRDVADMAIAKAAARWMEEGCTEPWDMPPDGVMSKMIRGVVELRPWRTL